MHLARGKAPLSLKIILMTEFEWKGHQLIHSKSEKIALVKKAEAKDCKLSFLERENARLRVRCLLAPAARQHMRLVGPLSGFSFSRPRLIFSAFESLN